MSHKSIPSMCHCILDTILKLPLKEKTTTTTARITVIRSHYFMLIQSIALSYAKTHNPQINEGICA